jgi:acyl carrier protein
MVQSSGVKGHGQAGNGQRKKEILVLLEAVREILVELLDVAAEDITPQSYLVRDLGMESIDFLELAVALNQRFRVPVHDDTVFLRNLRLHMIQAREAGQSILDGLKRHYGFLPDARLSAISADLEGGPVIQVQDLMSYIRWQMTNAKAA